MPLPVALERNALRRGTIAAWLVLLATARCTFPDYNLLPDAVGGSGASSGQGGQPTSGTGASSGSGGAGASSGAGGSSQGGAIDLPGGAPSTAGAPETAGGAPECAPEQWPIEHCAGGCLHRYPDHCFDTKLNADEIALNCGGSCQPCTNEPCTLAADCLSGQCLAGATDSSTCYAPLSIHYTAHEQNASVSSVAWSIKLSNNEPTGGEAYDFRDIKLRYYFRRSDIVEPLVVRATQSNLRLDNGQTRELKQTSWSIERTEAAAGVAYDAYVEVSFDESGQFFPGDSIDLYQQMLTGDTSNSNFDQRANYSFTTELDSEFLHISVLYQGRLVWGLEPRPANPRSCFLRGVNFNGPAVTVAGRAWQSSMQANVAPGGGSGVSQGGALFPPASAGLSTMMQTAFRLSAGAELSLPVANGSYLVFLYAVSPGSDATASSFTVQGTEPPSGSKFRSQAADGGQAWARMGPFRVDVTDATLRLGVTEGAINFAGLELWYPD
jgi:hypothetical protein